MRKNLTISDFYVHAVLQAARAYQLGLDINSSKSWGLNRAIFYEAAKKGAISRSGGKPRAGTPRRGGGGRPLRRAEGSGELYSVGREHAYAIREGHGVRFIIGGKVQTPEAFDRQVRRRFPQWDMVWSEATRMMAEADPGFLFSASRFHSQIYRRHRGELARRWPAREAGLVEPHKAA